MNNNIERQLITSAILVITLAHAAWGAEGQKTCANLAELAEPCGCTLTVDNFDPICGSDGQSYMTLCFLECKQTIDGRKITVEHKGPCSKKTNCVCNSAYDPVCGSNGVTYPNECVLACNIKKLSTLKLKHRGSCGDDYDSGCICNPTNSPVCANNGVSLPNLCVLHCKKTRDPSIKFAHWGDCEETYQIDDYDYGEKLNNPPKKKCGQNNRPTTQRPRPCDREESLKVEEKDDDTCYCSSVNRPLCASNSMTYANMCVLHCTRNKDPSVKFVRWGGCEQDRSDENIRLVSRGKIKYYDHTLRNARANRASLRFDFQPLHGRPFRTN